MKRGLSTILSLLYLICLCTETRGQQLDRFVIANGGEYFQNNLLTLSSTIGEPLLVETFTNPTIDVILSQGFQQNDLNTVLPVRLLYFKGTLKNNTIHLTWKVENEREIKAYVVERSNDGKLFTGIGHVTAQLNNNIQKAYYFDDPSIKQESTIFYRIKIIEQDQSFWYSSVIPFLNTLTSFSIYPNPANQIIMLSFQSQSAFEPSINILNTAGIVVATATMPIKKGTNQIPLNISKLPQGAYFLMVGQQSTHCFLKK